MTVLCERVRRTVALVGGLLTCVCGGLAALSACGQRSLDPIVAINSAGSGGATSNPLPGIGGTPPEIPPTAGSGGRGLEPQDPYRGIPAVQISVERADFNQATAITLVSAGSPMLPESREARIVKNRGGLLSVSWTLNSDFTAREIEARLVLNVPGQAPKIESDVNWIGGPSDPTRRRGAFRFHINADDVQPGTTFGLGLYETESADPAVNGPDSTRTPALRDIPLAVSDSFMQLSVRLVPLSTYSETSPLFGAISNLRDLIYDIHPIETLDLDVTEAIPPTRNALSDVCALKESDAADYIYYVGIGPETVSVDFDAVNGCGVLGMEPDASFPSVSFARVFQVLAALQGVDVNASSCAGLTAQGYAQSLDDLFGPAGWVDVACPESANTWLSPHHYEMIAQRIATASKTPQ